MEIGEMIKTIITTILSGSVIAAFISANFNEKNSLHSESNWRSDLYNISQKTYIEKKDLETFRTSVSSTRGYNGWRFDLNTANSYPNIDDICLYFYHFLIDNAEFRRIDRDSLEYSYLISDQYCIVFRQLCRLLLKSDWNKRKKSFLKKFACIKLSNEIEEKAVKLLYSIDIVPSYRNRIINKYFDKIINDKKIIEIDFKKFVLILTTILSIVYTLLYIKSSFIIKYFNEPSNDEMLINGSKFFILYPFIFGTSLYLLFLIIRRIINKINQIMTIIYTHEIFILLFLIIIFILFISLLFYDSKSMLYLILKICTSKGLFHYINISTDKIYLYYVLIYLSLIYTNIINNISSITFQIKPIKLVKKINITF